MQIEAATKSPKAALKYWKGKAPVSKVEFEALSDAARARAFAVSGLARRSQIEAIHTALHQAIDKGETLAQFKQRLRPLMEQKGWTGKKAWRIENIYRTNMQSAYQAGRFAQMKATAKRRPYWRYVAVKDSRTRPTHSALNGKVFPHDHGFWDSWYPPNGFMCRCTVQTLSKRQVDAKDIQVESRVPRLVEPIDPVSGNRLPARPLAPDPGWAGNVGRDWLEGLAPGELDDGYTITNLGGKAICKDGKGLFSSGGICKPPLRTIDKRHILHYTAKDLMSKGLRDEEYVKAFLSEFGVTDINGSTTHILPGNVPVVISKELFWDRRYKRFKATKQNREPYIRLLARTLKNPYEVWYRDIEIKKKGKSTGRIRSKLTIIRMFKGPDGNIGGFAVFDLIGGQYWRGTTVFTPGTDDFGKKPRADVDKYIFNYLEKERNGTLVYREP